MVISIKVEVWARSSLRAIVKLDIDPHPGAPALPSLCLLCLGPRENRVVLGSSRAFWAGSPDSMTGVTPLSKCLTLFAGASLLNKERCVPCSCPRCCSEVSSLLNRRLRKKGRILMKLVSPWKPQARGQQRDTLKVPARTCCRWRPERVENFLTDRIFEHHF